METLFDSQRPVDRLSPGELENYRYLFFAHQRKYPAHEVTFRCLTDRESKPIHSPTYLLLHSLVEKHEGGCVLIPDLDGNTWRVWVERLSNGGYFRGMSPEPSATS